MAAIPMLVHPIYPFDVCDRLRLVRLLAHMLPSGLQTPHNDGDDDDESVPIPNKFNHWPAVVYKDLTELLNCLPPELSAYKNELMMNQSHSPNHVVARLFAWKSSTKWDDMKSNGVPESLYFQGDDIAIVRLSSTSFDDNELDDNEIIDLFDNFDRFICASEDLIAKYKDSSDSNEKQICEHALQFNDAITVALDERHLSTSASNNADNDNTEVVDGVEGDAFSATEQSRFHPPDQPKLRRRKRDKALSKDSRAKRLKAMQKKGGSRLVLNRSVINQTSRNNRTCLLDAIIALLPSNENKQVLCSELGSSMPRSGDTAISCANEALKGHGMILRVVSKEYHKKGGAAFHLMQELQCRLVINIKLTNRKKEVMSHFISWDGMTLYDQPQMSIVNNTYDRAHEKGSKNVFEKLYKKTDFLSWQITGIYRLENI
jgi:hypothetical protein